MSRLEIAYLGVAGWSLHAGPSTLLIDPYFTRLSYRHALFGAAIPDTRRIALHTPPADVILVTHPHYDHLMDVPEAARLTGAPVYASPQGCALLRTLGVPDDRRHAIRPGDHIESGTFRIEAYRSQHRTLLGGIPYTGPLRPGLKPPLSASDYRMDMQFSFLIRNGETSVLVAGGIDDEPPVRAAILLVGADATADQLARILTATRPLVVFPNHWDDMFRPLDKPTRPMLIPPRGRIPSLRRIDLDRFAREVKRILPDARVILPEVGRRYTV